MPGREIVALLLALLCTVVVLDLLLAGRLTLLFDLAFITGCVLAAIAVRVQDLFTIGVAPPLVMVVIVVLLAVADPAAVAHADDGVVQATVSGLSTHGIALAIGYLSCLAVLGARSRAAQSAA